MKLSHKKAKSIAENETFVRMIQVAQEDSEFRHELISVLFLDSFNRRSLLNSFIESMRLKKAPGDLIESFANLLDDEVARAVLEVIDGIK